MADQRVNIKVSTQGAGKAKTELKGVNGAISKMGKAVGMASAAYFGARGLINGFSAVIKLAGEQEKAETKLNAVLKSTGGVAGLTATELKKMASSLQDVTTFGDETIINAQSLLLTFTNIGEDVFPKATETILNMSTAMGTDLQSSTVQLGKALNDPITGISALSRVGVQLTNTQKEQIKSFTEVGDVASAQKVILGELETQFGGLAKATAETMPGAIEQMNNAVGDAGEELGKVLAPVVIATAKGMKTLAEGVGNVIERFKDFGKEIDAVLLDKTALAKQEIDAFRDSVKGLSETELLDLGSEIERSGEKMGLWTDETTLNNEKLKILEDTILALRERQETLGQSIETTTELRKTETGVVFELDAEYQKFIETQKVKLANQVAEAGMTERLIQDYPKLAKALGLVNDEKKKSKSLTDDNISAIKSWAFALNSAAQINRDKSHANALFAKRAAQLEAIVNTASAMTEVLPNVPLSIAMGVLGAIQVAKIESATFARGGDFVTSGPRNILVGDNPGGRERVQVTPLSSPNFDGPQGGITLNISAPLVDETVIDHIIPAIHKAQRMSLA